MKYFSADHIYAKGELLENHAMLVDESGTIAAIGPGETLGGDTTDTVDEMYVYPGCVLLPGCINSHVHSFQVYLRGRSESSLHFQDWVTSHLYPLILSLDATSLHSAALLAYHEMILSGTTTVGEFHYVHHVPGCERGSGAHQMIQAAETLGLRIVLLRALYDRGTHPAQSRFHESPSEALQRLEDLHAQYADHPLVSIRPAPHSLHGASGEMIEGAADFSRRHKVPMHIHLAEQESDIEYAHKHYGCGPLTALQKLGGLHEHTVLVHGCWLDQSERELLAEMGGGLAYNPLTNMALGDGVTEIPDLIQRGVPISLGTDANIRLSIYDEARAVEYIQRLTQKKMGILSPESQEGHRLLDMATIQGGRNLGIPCGSLEVGQQADMVVLDTSDPSLQPGALEAGEALLSQIIFSMVPQTAIQHAFVGGQQILRHRSPTLFSRQELHQLILSTHPRYNSH